VLLASVVGCVRFALFKNDACPRSSTTITFGSRNRLPSPADFSIAPDALLKTGDAI
jgi:hypothetical protein